MRILGLPQATHTAPIGNVIIFLLMIRFFFIMRSPNQNHPSIWINCHCDTITVLNCWCCVEGIGRSSPRRLAWRSSPTWWPCGPGSAYPGSRAAGCASGAWPRVPLALPRRCLHAGKGWGWLGELVQKKMMWRTLVLFSGRSWAGASPNWLPWSEPYVNAENTTQELQGRELNAEPQRCEAEVLPSQIRTIAKLQTFCDGQCHWRDWNTVR